MRSILIIVCTLFIFSTNAQNYQVRRFENIKQVELRNMVKTDDGVVLAATTGGVYKSNDVGQNWVLFNDGLSELADEDWRISNGIREIWNTDLGIYVATEVGALFKLENNRWKHILPEYAVEDLAVFNGELYIAGKERDVFFARNFYRVESGTGEVRHLLAMTSSFFNTAEPLTAVNEGIILGEPNSILFYDGEEIINISPQDVSIYPFQIIGESINDFYVVSRFIFTFQFLNNLYHYNGESYEEKAPREPSEFFVINAFELEGEMYLHGIENTVGVFKLQILKEIDLILNQTWYETSGYSEVTPPNVQGIVNLGLSDYLYYTPNEILHSTNNLGNATTPRENNIYNGTFENITGIGNFIYYREDEKIRGLNANTGEPVATIDDLENDDFREINNSDDFVWAQKIDLVEDSIYIYSTDESGTWKSNKESFNPLSVNSIGGGENTIDFLGHNEDPDRPWVYLSYDIEADQFVNDDWIDEDTALVRYTLRNKHGRFTHNIYAKKTYSSNGWSVSSSTDYWSIHFKPKDGDWMEVKQTRNSYSTDWDHRPNLVGNDDGDVYIVHQDRDYLSYFPRTYKTMIRKYDPEFKRFRVENIVEDEITDISYQDGLWQANISGKSMFSEDFENWFDRSIDGLPEAAEITTIKRIGNVVFVGTRGNGVFHQDLSTSIADLKLEQNILVYPNPSNGIFNIAGKDLNELEIFGLDGRLLLQKTLSTQNDNHEINLSALPTGIYLLRCLNEQGEIFTKKIQVQR